MDREPPTPLDLRTRLARAYAEPAGRNRPVSPPVERATTLLAPEWAALRAGAGEPVYGLDGLASQTGLRAAVAALEGAGRVALLPTGLAAVAVAVMALVDAGEEALAADSLYGPTRKFLNRTLTRFGVGVRYFPPDASPEAALALAGERTRVLLLESPGSLTFEVLDVAAFAAAARARGVRTVVDNSWAAGLLFQPLAHGADLSVQALTKYAAGHSDVFAGSVASTDAEIARRVQAVVEDMGWHLSPDDAWLVLRGMRTLPLRMAEQGRSGLEVARWLERQPEIARVLHPALPGSPGHDLWRRDFSGAAGLFGAVLKPGPSEAVRSVLDRLKLFGRGYSWGGFESLATYEDPQLAQRRHHADLGGPLIRLHVGLEAPADLIADLRQALDGYPHA